MNAGKLQDLVQAALNVINFLYDRIIGMFEFLLYEGFVRCIK